MMRKLLVVMLATVLCAASAGVSYAAENGRIVMQIDDGKLKGLSQLEGYKEWHDVLSFSAGYEQPANIGTGSMRRTSAPNIKELSLTMPLNATFPLLAGAPGVVYPKVILHFGPFIRGKEPFSSRQIILERVLISSAAMEVQGGSTDVLSLSLHFEKIQWKSEAINPNTGKKEGDIIRNWNILTGNSK